MKIILIIIKLNPKDYYIKLIFKIIMQIINKIHNKKRALVKKIYHNIIKINLLIINKIHNSQNKLNCTFLNKKNLI